jgi:hypothetical protein
MQRLSNLDPSVTGCNPKHTVWSRRMSVAGGGRDASPGNRIRRQNWDRRRREASLGMRSLEQTANDTRDGPRPYFSSPRYVGLLIIS